MKIIEWSQFLKEALPIEKKTSAITIGVFDGVHRGHRTLIERIVAHNSSSIPVVITFRQSNFKKKHPDKQDETGDITSFRQKTAIFAELGVALTVVVDFSQSFSRLRGTDFLRLLLDQGKMSFLVVGSNFRCGYEMDTDAAAIQNFSSSCNLSVDIVQPIKEGERTINSSLIRTAIAQGMLKDAAAMLARPYTLDLGGAAIKPSPVGTTSGDAYDISNLGRVLPPPGSYQVILYGKKDGGDIKRHSEVLINERALICVNSADCGSFWEYAEFV